MNIRNLEPQTENVLANCGGRTSNQKPKINSRTPNQQPKTLHFMARSELASQIKKENNTNTNKGDNETLITFLGKFNDSSRDY